MTTEEDWLRVYRPRPGGRRLYCLAHASGNATFYRGWAARLPADVELVAVQYPGRLDRIGEPCVPDMDTMADSVAALLAAQPHGAALFGHSMGASVGYEVAHRLEHRYGAPLAHLFVSGRPAPKHHRPGDKHLGSDDLLWNELRRLGGTGDDALEHPQLRAMVIPALRADYRLIETYEPTLGPQLTVPVTALTGDHDPDAPVAEVADWEHATSGRFALRVFPGGHFYLVPEEEAVLAAVAEALGPVP